MATDFDLRALYDALDAERQARGLSWAAAARQISAVGSQQGRRPIASSTITGLRDKALAEADGVLQMLRWLKRSPESFIAGMPAQLPDAASHQVLRFDTRKLADTLDAARQSRGLTWSRIARETGVAESHMRGLKRGGRTAFPGVMRLTQWLNRPASDFIRLTAY